jgi:hypothetical protein
MPSVLILPNSLFFLGLEMLVDFDFHSSGAVGMAFLWKLGLHWEDQQLKAAQAYLWEMRGLRSWQAQRFLTIFDHEEIQSRRNGYLP